MNKRLLCLEVFEGIEEDILYPLTREAGFDGFFSSPDVAHDLEALRRIKKTADALRLFQETVHSSIKNCWTIWHEGPEGAHDALASISRKGERGKHLSQ